MILRIEPALGKKAHHGKDFCAGRSGNAGGCIREGRTIIRFGALEDKPPQSVPHCVIFRLYGAHQFKEKKSTLLYRKRGPVTIRRNPSNEKRIVEKWINQEEGI